MFEIENTTIPQRIHAINKRFLPGHVPHNKGKKWSEYMSEEGMKKAFSYLERGRNKPGQPHPAAGWNKRKVVFFDENGIPHTIESANAAGRLIGADGRNVRAVCDGKRKHVKGYQFWWWDSDEFAEIYRERTNRSEL